MNSKTKIILTIVGLAAIIVPAILLVVFSGKKGTETQTNLPTGTRQIDKGVIQKGIQPDSAQAEVASPSPTPSPIIQKSPSPTPNLQGTPSGVN